MDKAEFDRFADAYYDQHRENVAVTGEGPEYFAEYKIRQLRQLVELRVPRQQHVEGRVGQQVERESATVRVRPAPTPRWRP